MKKFLVLILLVSVIFVSGCESTKSPVDSEDLDVSTEPLIIKEFNEQDVSVSIFNNNSVQAIDAVSVSSFDLFTIVGSSSQVNIPAGKRASVSFRVIVPSFFYPGN